MQPRAIARRWDLSGQRGGLQSGSARLSVEATGTLRFVNEDTWGFEEEMDLTWEATGTVGHRHPISDQPEDGRLDLEIADEEGWF